MKARNPEYTKGYKAGMQQGFRLARKTFGDVVDLALVDVLDASPEESELWRKRQISYLQTSWEAMWAWTRWRKPGGRRSGNDCAEIQKEWGNCT